jgi:hypothetical protein
MPSTSRNCVNVRAPTSEILGSDSDIETPATEAIVLVNNGALKGIVDIDDVVTTLNTNSQNAKTAQNIALLFSFSSGTTITQHATVAQDIITADFMSFGFTSDGEDASDRYSNQIVRFDGASSTGAYCILQGDILQVEYTDPTDASGDVNTVTDSGLISSSLARNLYIL